MASRVAEEGEGRKEHGVELKAPYVAHTCVHIHILGTSQWARGTIAQSRISVFNFEEELCYARCLWKSIPCMIIDQATV